MKTSKMETLLLIAAWIAVGIIFWQIISCKPSIHIPIKIKKHYHARTQKDQEIEKLLRSKRGNTPLTNDQQILLDKLNKHNFKTLKQMWKDEHL